jgi:DNA (cytosine-5)-methyltransferase 3A
MSCGQIALERAGIKVNKYYASEIKPHAIEVTQHNYPNTIQVGDVTKINAKDLPKIDLLIGGSPCQDFSSANKQKLGLAGEKSGLFYEYLRLLKELNPKYFLLENVAMDDFSYQTISHLVGTFPVDINSSLVSGQLRQRTYWTNIGDFYTDLFGMRHSIIQPPKDKKIFFQDILDDGYTDRVKSRCLLESESRNPGSTYSSLRRYMIMGFINVIFKNKETYEKYSKMTEDEMKRNFIDGDIRKLYKSEMERLQTVPEGYTDILKRNDAACLLGDGWTVDVIAHIFKNIK